MASQQLFGILQIQIRAGGWDELPLYRAAVSLGRGIANQIVLQDPKVSSQHAELTLGRDGWLVSDLGSSNGTFLEGQRLPPGTHVPFQPGQTVTIGEFALSIRLLHPNETPPPSLGDQVSIGPKPQPGLAVYIGGKVRKVALDKNTLVITPWLFCIADTYSADDISPTVQKIQVMGKETPGSSFHKFLRWIEELQHSFHRAIAHNGTLFDFSVNPRI